MQSVPITTKVASSNPVHDEVYSKRPLYAVISTLLEQSKEQKDAEGAAEEYYRMKVLEAAMIEQKLITSVSIFVRLRSTSIL
jgi:hypothetical protein